MTIKAMKIGSLAALMAILAPSVDAGAQESVFNVPAFGVPSTGESVRTRALGGAGLGLPSVNFSLENPAQTLQFTRAGIFLSIYGQDTKIEGPEASGSFDDVVFPVGQLVFPSRRMSFFFGYYQFVDFDASLESSTEFEGDTLPVTFDSEGGLSVFAPGVGYRMDPSTHIGLSLDIYQGSREVIRRIVLDDLAGNPLAVADSLSRDFRGLGVTLGAEREVGLDNWISIAYRFRPTVSSRVTVAPGDSLIGFQSDFKLPNELILGGAATMTPEVTVSGVFRYAGWSGFEGDDLIAESYGNSFELGGGVEWAPRVKRAFILGPTSPLRGGFRWRRLPLKLEDESVTEWAGSVGWGIGLGPRSQIDLAFEFGRRGSLEANRLTERFLRFGVGLSVFEQWRRNR